MQNDPVLSKDQTSYERQIPLFPLQAVLFPGGFLPLHIFEPRYRTMIKFCLEHESEFGVVLIKEGEETGETAVPCDVGTAVRILHVEHLDDGRMHIVTAGEYRFQILEIQEHLSYLTGRVRMLDDLETEVESVPESLTAQTEELYKAYETLSSRLIFAWSPPEEQPDDPRELAYQVGIRLRISLKEKQTLLETIPLEQLLTREIEILTDQNRRIAFQLAAQNN
ncbi:MAG: LON peptidase substrate-binding domain-containing protein [Candidatus Poribacteria bacterium]|nr:LON peptidase substrate-binding domain-containing protein [Candidatus Poribacteria bacterium]MDE0324692.1 LON peptidase substrate-binding domain-containing protein [Candidatus Poribacteria bacterium]